MVYPIREAEFQRILVGVCHRGDTGLVRYLINEACFDGIRRSWEAQLKYELHHKNLHDVFTFRLY